MLLGVVIGAAIYFLIVWWVARKVGRMSDEYPPPD
jgi:hypothetical protein